MSDLSLSPTRPSLTIANRTFTDVKNLKRLICYASGTNNGSFRLPEAAAGYTPSGALRFQVLAIEYWSFQVAALGEVALLAYSDNDCTIDAATALTNPVYPGGNAAIAGLPWLVLPVGKYELATDFVVPNTKFLSVECNTAAARVFIAAYGYEIV